LDSDNKKTNGAIPSEKLNRYLKMSVDSVRREVTLIETLLSATKLEGHRVQLSFTKVDLADVIADSIEALKQSARDKKLDLEIVQSDGTVIQVNNEADPNVAQPRAASLFVYADRTRTQEVMDNFLSNAIKYTAKGKVSIVLSTKDEFGRIDVKDSGVGIDPADLANLGKKFFRAQSLFAKDPNLVQPSGTGLGLYVTFELIKIMNGQREISSVVGQGSDFAFMLPLFDGQKDTNTDQTFMKQKS
jgi:signal transduction histidine kinase